MLRLVRPVIEGNPHQPTGTLPPPCRSRRRPLRMDHGHTDAGCTVGRHPGECPGSGRNCGETGQGEGIDPGLEVNERQPIAITCADPSACPVRPSRRSWRSFAARHLSLKRWKRRVQPWHPYSLISQR
jgi:hypothetical protein